MESGTRYQGLAVDSALGLVRVAMGVRAPVTSDAIDGFRNAYLIGISNYWSMWEYTASRDR